MHNTQDFIRVGGVFLILYLLGTIGSAGYAYFSIKPSEERRKISPLAICLAPLAFLLWVSLFLFSAVLFAILLILFPFALLIVKDPKKEKKQPVLLLWVGRTLLRTSQIFLSVLRLLYSAPTREK